ncbi:MAG: lytic transglycosylase domain-containing protein [Clostridium sp.]
MSFKKILVFLLVVLILILGGNYILKKYVFPIKYEEYITKYAEEFEVDPLLILSIMKTESNFSNDAKSNKDAKGLMQIMDQTGEWAAEELGIVYFMPNMMYDPEMNIKIGTWYVDRLNDEFNGDLELMLAAYNGGSGNVTKWLKNTEYSSDGKTLDYIPFPETKKYVDRVKTYYSIYKYLYNNSEFKIENVE